MKLRCQHMIGIAAEAFVAQRDMRCFAGRRASPTQRRPQPLVGDAAIWQFGFEMRTIEVWIPGRGRAGPQIHYELDLMGGKSSNKLAEIACRVPDRPNAHSSSLSFCVSYGYFD